MKAEPLFICLPNFQQVVGLAMLLVAAPPAKRFRHSLTVAAQQGLQQPVVCWYFPHLQRKVVVYTADFNAKYMKIPQLTAHTNDRDKAPGQTDKLGNSGTQVHKKCL